MKDGRERGEGFEKIGVIKWDSKWEMKENGVKGDGMKINIERKLNGKERGKLMSDIDVNKIVMRERRLNGIEIEERKIEELKIIGIVRNNVEKRDGIWENKGN